MKRVGIVGLGLMGGSLAMALRRLDRGVDVAGVDAAPDTRADALRRKVVSSVSDDPRSVADCDLVVLATPISALQRTLATIASSVSSTTLITDLASVKAPVIQWAQSQLPQPARFLGGHPMTGKTDSGLAHADPSMFAGAAWIFTPQLGQQLEPFAPWFELVAAIGARPRFMAADLHDLRAALVSHLAFTLSAAYADSVFSMQERADVIEMAGPGFRDVIRLAGGDPAMYADIARANRTQLLSAIDAFSATLQTYRRRIAADEGLETMFAGARHAVAR